MICCDNKLPGNKLKVHSQTHWKRNFAKEKQPWSHTVVILDALPVLCFYFGEFPVFVPAHPPELHFGFQPLLVVFTCRSLPLDLQHIYSPPFLPWLAASSAHCASLVALSARLRSALYVMLRRLRRQYLRLRCSSHLRSDFRLCPPHLSVTPVCLLFFSHSVGH